MPEYLVGTDGWDSFKVSRMRSLKDYSSLFNFVEVNRTFYEYPDNQLVEAWREVVPKSFTFSVRCHQDLTHKIGLKPINQAYEVFYQMRTYCDKLGSQYLVLETPADYAIDIDCLRDARDFFSSLDLEGIVLVWEYRAPITQMVTNLMLDFNVIKCVDLSRERPSNNMAVTYSRLFGKGQHNIYQFTDEELVEIDHNAQGTDSKTVILSYQSLRMNTDALRFKGYKATGSFQPVTSRIGADSAQTVLSEDSKFPTTKSELIVEQGWKVIDASEDKRVHLSEVLNKIPNKIYFSLDEVINELRTIL